MVLTSAVEWCGSSDWSWCCNILNVAVCLRFVAGSAMAAVSKVWPSWSKVFKAEECLFKWAVKAVRVFDVLEKIWLDQEEGVEALATVCSSVDRTMHK